MIPDPRYSEHRHGHPHVLRTLAPSNIKVSRLNRPARLHALLRFVSQVALRYARMGLPRGGLLPG